MAKDDEGFSCGIGVALPDGAGGWTYGGIYRLAPDTLPECDILPDSRLCEGRLEGPASKTPAPP